MDAERAVTTSTKRQYVQFKIACNHMVHCFALMMLPTSTISVMPILMTLTSVIPLSRLFRRPSGFYGFPDTGWSVSYF